MPCTEGFFAHEGVRYRYLRWQGAPDVPPGAAPAPLVLLHGFAQSAGTWEGAAVRLAAQGRPVLALDLVGHGGSGRPAHAGPYALGAQAAALLAFLSHVAGGCADGEAERPQAPKPSVAPAPAPVVAGYSMGGRVALVAAGRRPAAFGGLVLESAGLGPASARERRAAAERTAQWAAQLREGGLAAFMDAWEQLPLFASQRGLPPQVRARVREGRLANSAEALALALEGAGQQAMPGRREALAALAGLEERGVAVLYLAGSLDRKYRLLAQGLRDRSVCRVEVVPGAGHNVHLEAPEAFARLVEEACRRA